MQASSNACPSGGGSHRLIALPVVYLSGRWCTRTQLQTIANRMTLARLELHNLKTAIEKRKKHAAEKVGAHLRGHAHPLLLFMRVGMRSPATASPAMCLRFYACVPLMCSVVATSRTTEENGAADTDEELAQCSQHRVPV